MAKKTETKTETTAKPKNLPIGDIIIEGSVPKMKNPPPPPKKEKS
jgi:hypothetical protein